MRIALVFLPAFLAALAAPAVPSPLPLPLPRPPRSCTRRTSCSDRRRRRCRAGARVAVLLGDPSADGPFVIRLMLPKGYRIPPHSHSRDEQLTVISGTIYLGMGDVYEPSTARGLAAGGSTCCPPGRATSRTRSSRRSSR